MLEVVRVGLVTDAMSVLVEAEKMWNHLRLQLSAGRGGVAASNDEVILVIDTFAVEVLSVLVIVSST